MTLTPELRNSRFFKACRQEPVDTTPVWIMRQAGRYLPEYMAVRSKVKFIELCKTPQLAAEVTLTAQRVLGVDAAILFADLLPILEPMGLNLEYAAGEGPVIHNPVKTAGEVDRVRELETVESLSYVYDAVRIIRRELPPNIPLIGFAGAPFTLASYVIEGGSSKNYIHTKTLMYTDPGAWRTLMQRLAGSLGRYLQAQVAAGCQVIQLFDSWAGCLSPADYREYVLPYTRQVIQSVPHEVPVINFLTGNPALLPLCRDAGGDVIGLDWRVDLKTGWAAVGPTRGVQGNLDPITLYADLPTIRRRANEVLLAAEGRPGHIFNLGHGVTPDVPHQNVKALVQMVHELGAGKTTA
ncbi:MAG: uroporphyrinogen decarboxylase [Planctomycetaceae bacterium]